MKKILITILLLMSCSDNENNNAELKYIENWCINNNGLPHSYHNRQIRYSDPFPTESINIDCMKDEYHIFFINSTKKYKLLLKILYGHKNSIYYESKIFFNKDHRIDRNVWVIFIVKNHTQKDIFDKINTLDTVHKKTFVHVNELK